MTGFTEGDFAGIPLPPLAEEAGERSEEDDIVTRSYFVRNRTPEQILDFYAEYFDDNDIAVIMSPEPVGTTAWRGRWLLDGRELLVSAIPAPTASGSDVVTQMSLELWPEGESDHDDDADDDAPTEGTTSR